ncbi:hypothetical protein YC2023_066170 [Brassica napus]
MAVLHISARWSLDSSTLALPVDRSVDFGPHGMSVQYTQDVRGCPPAHTGRVLLSVAVLHISARWSLDSSTLALPVDCSGDFDPRGLFVQYIPDVRGCLSAHTGRRCVSLSTNRTSGAVRVCPSVSVSTHMTSVAVHQYTYQHVVPWTQHADPFRALFGTSVAVLQYTYQHDGPWTQHAGPSSGLFG